MYHDVGNESIKSHALLNSLSQTTTIGVGTYAQECNYTPDEPCSAAFDESINIANNYNYYN